MGKTLGIILQVALIVVAIVTQQYYAAAALGVGLIGTILAPTPQKPTLQPQDIKLNTKQERPPRVRGYGRDRLYGYFMLRETKDGTLYDIRALHHTPVDGMEAIYLHDEIVTIGTDDLDVTQSVIAPAHFTTSWTDDGIRAAYIRVETCLGLVPEVALPLFTAALPFWTAAHRGDGIAKIGLICQSAGPERVSQIYPNLAPEPSAVTRMSKVFDPRAPAQSRADPSTWTWSQNNALILADYISHPDGFRFSWERRIQPALDEWIAAADVCAEQVPLRDGGFEDRYHFDGIYQLTARPADVLPQLLSTMDGWLYLRPDGAFGIKAGKYEAPTVTIPDRHILDSQIRRNRKNEDVVNTIMATFTSIPHDYGRQPVPAWRDEASIALVGEKSRLIDLGNVKQFGQARRLMKRVMARMKPDIRGTIRTDAYGVAARGQRYITIDLTPRGYGMLIVEVTGYRLTLWPLSASIDWIVADVDIDAWDAATEEGDKPPVPAHESTQDRLTLPTPEILSIASESYDAGGGSVNVIGVITITDPGRTDLLPAVQYRALGTTTWRYERVAADATDGSRYMHHTVPLIDGQTYEFQARFENAGGLRGNWTFPPMQMTADAAAPPITYWVTESSDAVVTETGDELVF